MRFEPFIAVPLSLLVAACSSSKFNSLIEARSMDITAVGDSAERD